MTRLEKYGNANFSNKAKSNITRAKKLEENPNYYKDITKKCKATKLKNHGNANFVNVEKCKKTKLEKYGANVIVQSTILTAYDGTKLNARNIIGEFSPEKKRRILLLAHWDCRPWADSDPNPANLQDKPMRLLLR